MREKDLLNQLNNILPPQTKLWLSRFLTCDSEMIKLLHRTIFLAQEEDPVLIVGESGTGKELIAHALHGSRKGQFVAMNCTALPSELIESELFGHIKGSYTGAIADRIGKFEHAANGTIFLDEIGDMPINMQAKLLRVLQERLVSPLGSNEERKINCRIIAATNQDPKKLLRNDLYYRLATFQLRTKPLRARRDDIEIILDYLDIDRKLPIDIKEALKESQLNGNVRELEMAVKRFNLFEEKYFGEDL